MSDDLTKLINGDPATFSSGYAGKGEESVYDRKGFPPIEIVNDPAAIREAALREAADVRISHSKGYEFIPTRFRDAIIALIGEKK